MPALVRDMLDSNRHKHGGARHAIHGCNNGRIQPFGENNMNNSGTRQARAVQSGFKESPSAMGQSRDNNAMNPSRILRRF